MFLTIFRVFKSYDGWSKLDSVLYTENNDDLYGFSAINVELVEC